MDALKKPLAFETWPFTTTTPSTGKSFFQFVLNPYLNSSSLYVIFQRSQISADRNSQGVLLSLAILGESDYQCDKDWGSPALV